MTKLPLPPPEIPANRDLDKLAPQFRAKIDQLLDRMEQLGHDPIIAEGFRSDERQRFLYGFGREYDDGRGVVTQAENGKRSWHRFGLAVDIISKAREWDAPEKFWHDLSREAEDLGLTSGGHWYFVDKPHVQWGPPMRQSPRDAWDILQADGLEAVWVKIGAA